MADLKSTNLWDNVIVRIIQVIVWNKTSVYFIRHIFFRYLVFQDFGSRDALFDKFRHFLKKLVVFLLFVPGVPLVTRTILASLNHKNWALIRHDAFLIFVFWKDCGSWFGFSIKLRMNFLLCRSVFFNMFASNYFFWKVFPQISSFSIDFLSRCCCILWHIN